MPESLSKFRSSVAGRNFILEQLADAIEAGDEMHVEAMLARYSDHAEELNRMMPVLRALVKITSHHASLYVLDGTKAVRLPSETAVDCKLCRAG